MRPTKACPIVARLREDKIDVLMFRHPLAGTQLVKGTIEPGESAAAAAVRELAEESGILHSEAIHPLGLWTNVVDGRVWSFHLIACHHNVPETWDHWTHDDGGLVFNFFWHPLVQDPADACHPTFMGALDYLRTVLTPSIVRLALVR